MNILKSKKGIALENAILFMMIIFSLCFLITSFTLIGHYQGKIDNTKITQRVKLDQIGEDYLVERENLQDEYINYDFEATANTLKVWHKNDADSTLLYVEVDENNDVTAWRYSEPND